MNPKLRRTTANLPEELLGEAMKATGQGITETLVEGLKLVRRSRAFRLSRSLRGKVKFNYSADISRERTRS